MADTPRENRLGVLAITQVVIVWSAWCGALRSSEPIDIGSRLELFVDDYVIEFPIGCSAAEADIDVVRVVWRSRNGRTAQCARCPLPGRQVSTEW